MGSEGKSQEQQIARLKEMIASNEATLKQMRDALRELEQVAGRREAAKRKTFSSRASGS